MATLQKGDKGGLVRSLQGKLTKLGYDTKGIDGDFGKNTESALKEYQKKEGLPVTGVADDALLSRLGIATGKENFFTKVIEKDPRYLSTKCIDDINLLEPVFRDKVQQIIKEAKDLGVKLMVYETYRSQERQEQLYKEKVTKLKKVGVHHYGLACDLVRNVGGEPSWKGDFSFLGQLAQKYHLVWGGLWTSIDDPYHLQAIAVEDQNALFAGEFYPDENYDSIGFA